MKMIHGFSYLEYWNWNKGENLNKEKKLTCLITLLSKLQIFISLGN